MASFNHSYVKKFIRISKTPSSKKMKKQEQKAPHVICLPIPAQGHIKPMLKLAELLSHANLQVSFINFEFIHNKFISSIDIQAFQNRFPKFQFLSIADGFRLPSHPRFITQPNVDVLLSIVSATKPALIKLLSSYSHEAAQPPTCIIVDGLISSVAIEAAEEFAITIIAFRTYSACCTWTNFHLEKLVEEGIVPLQEKDMDKLITCIPRLENILRHRDLPSNCRVERADHPLLEFFMMQSSAMKKASSLVLNTIDELERPILSKLNSIFPKIYTIGPLHGLSKVRIKDGSSFLASRKSIHWQEDDSCITWLDSQPLSSVVYVCFGSVISLTHEDMLEFWHGLVNSGKPFLWAVRPESIIGENDPEKLVMDLETKTKGKGLIVSWAPQEEVLAHPAIGGFLTHSGWNSTLESIYAGIPMICWPKITDQQANSRCVSEVWRVGLDMKDSCERSIVEKMVRDLMEGKREEIMKSMNEIAKQAQESVKEGGSSYLNLEKLIEDIMSVTRLAP